MMISCHIQRFRASLRRNGNGFVVTTFNWQLAAMQHLLRHQKCGIIKWSFSHSANPLLQRLLGDAGTKHTEIHYHWRQLAGARMNTLIQHNCKVICFTDCISKLRNYLTWLLQEASLEMHMAIYAAAQLRLKPDHMLSTCWPWQFRKIPSNSLKERRFILNTHQPNPCQQFLPAEQTWRNKFAELEFHGYISLHSRCFTAKNSHVAPRKRQQWKQRKKL